MSTINRTSYETVYNEESVIDMVNRWNDTYAVERGKLVSYEYENGEFFMIFTDINTGFSLSAISLGFFKQYSEGL